MLFLAIDEFRRCGAARKYRSLEETDAEMKRRRQEKRAIHASGPRPEAIP